MVSCMVVPQSCENKANSAPSWGLAGWLGLSLAIDISMLLFSLMPINNFVLTKVQVIPNTILRSKPINLFGGVVAVLPKITKDIADSCPILFKMDI